MSENQQSYRQIIKATSLFGGVQVFQIIIQVIRSKAVAVLLGPAGMGIAGLLNSTIGLISGFTNFGLGTSAVKDIAAAQATGNDERIARVIIVLRRLVWITGLLGSLVTLVLSKWLSKITFGNYDYTLAFIWIAITLLFNQLATGQLALLQGIRKLKHLARANVTGSALGLIFTVPLYYFWGIDGIVPGIIITSIISLTSSWLHSRKVEIYSVKVTREETYVLGKNMLTMGFMISLSGLTSLGASYLVRIFIRSYGGIDQVGLYNAGFTIITTYVGLVLTAMGTDYFPRLSAVAHSNSLCKQTINQQAEIVLLILAPIILVFLVFIRWVVILLYSAKFVAINDMITWAALGMFFKAVSWCIAFILLAKSAGKLFFWNELLANINMLLLNIIGYYFWGLTGLGISYLTGFLFYMLLVYFISMKKFKFSFNPVFIKIFIIQFTLVLSCFSVVKLLSKVYYYPIGLVLIAISLHYSYKELDKRIGLKEKISGVYENFRKKNK